MPEQKQLKNMKLMQQKISRQTVNRANDFVNELETIRKPSVTRMGQLKQKKNKGHVISWDSEAYQKASKLAAHTRLRHPGTFRSKPKMPSLPPSLSLRWAWLCDDKNNHVVISSGRDRATLDAWFGNSAVKSGCRTREHFISRTAPGSKTSTMCYGTTRYCVSYSGL